MPIKVRDVIKLLEEDGWSLHKHKGTSHRQFRHPTKPGKVTVPGKLSDDLTPGTENPQAGWPEVGGPVEYLIVIEKAENNWAAHAPDVLGCVATGSTVEETIQNMREALEFHLETMMEDGDALPLPAAQAVILRVDVQGPGGSQASAA